MIVRDAKGTRLRLHFMHDTDQRGRRRTTATLHPDDGEPCPSGCAGVLGARIWGQAVCSLGKPRKGIKGDNFSHEIGRSIALGRALAYAVDIRRLTAEDRTAIERDYKARPRVPGVPKRPRPLFHVEHEGPQATATAATPTQE